MNSFRTLCLGFLLILQTSAYAQSEHKRVLLEGTFDLPHYGHQGAIQNAITAAAKHFNVSPSEIDLIIGVTDVPASDFRDYKRDQIFSVAEKERQLRGFKNVFDVVRVPHLYVSYQFMKDHHIDLVTAGSDYIDPVRRDKYYNEPFEHGKFVNFERTEGINTTDILRRVAVHVVSALEARTMKLDLDLSERDRRLKLIEDFKALFENSL